MNTSLAERMEGSSRTSYQDIGNTRLIIRHKSKVDENVIGARARNIKTIFIETDEGERFKMPTTNLLAARAMARHISKGGGFGDETGTAIHEMVAEWRGLSNLDRHVRDNRKNIENEMQHDVRVTIAGRIDEITDTFRKMTKKRAYNAVVPQLLGEAPEDENEVAAEMERLRETLIVEGEEWDAALRSVARNRLRQRQSLEEAPVPMEEPIEREKGAKHQRDLQAALDQLFNGKGAERLDFDPKYVRFGERGRGGFEAPTEFIDFHAEVTAKLGALAPAVKNDSLSVYLSEIHDKLARRKKLTAEEKKTVGYALSVAGMTDRRLRLSQIEKSKPAESIEREVVHALAEWAEEFDPERILRETHQPSIHTGKSVHFRRGDTASVIPTPGLSRRAYPHANWLTEQTRVKLLNDAIKGSSDLVEVELADGSHENVYGFNLHEHASHNSQLGEDHLWSVAMDVVRWKSYPEQLKEVVSELSEDDIVAVLEKIDTIWEPSVGDSIRDQLFEAEFTADNIESNAEEIASEIETDNEDDPVSIRLENVGDMMSAEQLLQDNEIVFESNYDDLRLSFTEPEEAEKANMVLKQNGLPHLAEDHDITLGGNKADDFVRDVSTVDRHVHNDRAPTVRSDSYLQVNEMSVRDAMRVLDEENIDYTSYAPDRFDFYDAESLDRAKNVLEAQAIPVRVVQNSSPISENGDPTVIMAQLRDKVITLL